MRSLAGSHSAAGRSLLPCCPLQQRHCSHSRVCVPLPTGWILLDLFYRWGNQGSGKVNNLPKAGGQRGRADCFSGVVEKVRSRPTLLESLGYLVFVGGVEGDLSHFLITFAHQLHGAGGQLDALEQGRLGGIPGHIPLWGERAVRAE